MVAGALSGIKESLGLELPDPCAPTSDFTTPKPRVSETENSLSATSVLLSILHALFLGAGTGPEDADLAHDGGERDIFIF